MEIENVSTDQLLYWSEYPIGGSGLSIGIQKLLKSMALEILDLRYQISTYESDEYDRGDWE